MFKFDTTLQVHLELRSISLAPPTGLSTTLVAFNISKSGYYYDTL
jgi:hypothetical protein